MRPVAILCIAAACASQALAKPPEIRWARSWKDATAEAKIRNVPVVVVFAKVDADGGTLEKSVLGSSDVIFASKKWIAVYCNQDPGQPTKKMGDKVVSAVTPGLTEEDHIAAWKELAPKFFKGVEVTTPAVVWCDPEGEEKGRIAGKVTASELLSKVGETSKKIGPGLDGDEYVEAMEHLKTGDDATAGNKFEDAVREFGEVAKLEKTPGAKGVVQMSKERLNGVNDVGKTFYTRAMDCATGGDNVQAKSRLKEIMTRFDGLPVAKDAKKSYDELVAREKMDEKNGKSGDGKRR